MATTTNRTDKVLVVDDDARIRDLLRRYLTQEGFEVMIAEDGKALNRLLLRETVDIIVLDLMMPGEDGLALCRALRVPGSRPVPVLMLTARHEEADRILGLEMGADDYLTKPFSAREVLARIHAILRRTRMLPPNLQPEVRHASTRIGFGPWTLDTAARHLLDEDGTMVSLTGAEYRLLKVFVDHPRRVLSRDQLLNLTQGRDADPYDRSIDLLVSRLRHRLKDGVRASRYLKTVRNEGYVLSAEVVPR